MTKNLNKSLLDIYQFKPKEDRSYFCTNDVGLVAYLLSRGYILSGIKEREDGELLMFILKEEDSEIDDDIFNYQTGLTPNSILLYINNVKEIYDHIYRG